MYRVALALLEELVVRCRGAARELLVVHVQLAGRVRRNEKVTRTRHPLDASYSSFINQSLELEENKSWRYLKSLVKYSIMNEKSSDIFSKYG